MFGKKKQPPICSLIGYGTRIDGDIAFSEGLRVDGEVVGNIRAQEGQASMLVVSETACVTGAVQAGHVVVAGRIIGPVHASELLELQPAARIEGDVRYKALEMHQGAVIAGQLQPEVTGLLLEGEEKPTLKLAANNP